MDSRTVSTMRRLFARREDPVSVMSMIASTSSGAFTSVAPHENSTSAWTPMRARYCLQMPTASVAMRLPCRSLPLLIGESFGTAMTQRTGRSPCFA